MRTIKKCGGISIVQDPSEAQFPSMPLSVMHDIKVDYSLPIIEMGLLLARLSRERIEEEGQYPVSEDVELEVRIAQQAKESSELIASVESLAKYRNLPVLKLSRLIRCSSASQIRTSSKRRSSTQSSRLPTRTAPASTGCFSTVKRPGKAETEHV
jgi:hypothetical protein